MITIEYEIEEQLSFDCEKVATLVIEEVLNSEKCPYEIDVTLIITDNAEIQAVNYEFRHIDAPTDVLSFPLITFQEPAVFSNVDEDITNFHPETGELLLGDMVISIDKVKEQAQSYGHSELREFAFLIAHSMLHLFGYDHIEEEDRYIMEQKQRKLLEKLEILR